MHTIRKDLPPPNAGALLLKLYGSEYDSLSPRYSDDPVAAPILHMKGVCVVRDDVSRQQKGQDIWPASQQALLLTATGI